MVKSDSLDKDREQILLRIYTDYKSKKTDHYALDRVLNILPLINPENKIYITFRVLLSIVILVIFFSIPVDWAFGMDVWDISMLIFTLVSEDLQDTIVHFLIIFLFIEICTQFCTCYFKHGNLIKDKRRIVRRYLRCYFWFDMIAYAGILIAFYSRWVYVLFFLKYFEVSSLSEQYEQMILLYRKTRTIYKCIRVLIWILFCILCFACVFYAIGIWSYDNKLNTWLNVDGVFGRIIDLPVFERLFYAFYFSMGTMTTVMGYGDITPMNMYECSFSLVGILFAVIILAIMVNQMSRIIEEYEGASKRKHSYKVAMDLFMHKQQIPYDLRERVRQYLNENMYSEGNRNKYYESKAIKNLGSTLKQTLLFESYGIIFQNLNLEQNLKSKAIYQLAMKVREVNYSQNQCMFEQDKYDDHSLYFILSGKVLISYCKSYSLVIQKGQSIGEYGFITEMPRKAAAKTLNFTKTYRISRSDFISQLSKDQYYQLCLMKEQILCGQQSLGACWICQNASHFASDCDQTHYKPEISQVLVQYYSLLNSRRKFKRRVHREQTKYHFHQQVKYRMINRFRSKSIK